MNWDTVARRGTWGVIVLGLLFGAGAYFWLQTKAGITVGSDNPSFQADLKNTLSLQRGIGGPTFTRATTATVTDFEGLIKNVKSGEARFEGARRVENLIPTNSTTYTGTGSVTLTTGQTDPLGGTSATKVVYAATGLGNRATSNLAGVAIGNTIVQSVWLRGQSGGESISVHSGWNLLGSVTLTTDWKRYSFSGVADHSSWGAYIFANSGTPTIYADFNQAEDITGQANQNPSEYVSVGVLSSPYHGANVDGVKYFTTQNGNTVASNVVTETTGVAIADATLHGYVAEGARTNSILQSETLGTTWTATNITVADNSVVSPAGTTTAETLTASSNDATLSQAITGTATSWTFSVYLKRKTGTGTVSISADGTNFTACTIDASTWTRCTDTRTLTVASYSPAIKIATNTDAVYAWGAQMEAKACSSSYIPTVASAVTRNADSLTYPTSNVSASVGSIFAETIRTVLPGGQGRVVSFFSYYTPISIGPTSITSYDGATKASVSNTDLTAKVATWWNLSGSKMFVNGTTGSLGGVPTFDTSVFGIGIDQGSINQYIGTIRNVKIWKKVLTDTQLTKMTSTDDDVAQSAVKKTTVGSDNPSFQADLKNTLSLQRGIGGPTFTRPTIATVTDFEGLIKTVKSGEARFEGARRVENLFSKAEAFNDVSWAKVGPPTINQDVTIAPNGTLTAEKYIKVSGSNYLYQALNISLGTYVMSAYGKAGENSDLSFHAQTGGTDSSAHYNLSTGVISSVTNAVAAYIEPLSNGWYRCFLIFNVTVAGSRNYYFGQLSGTADGTAGFYIWGAQLENITGQANQNPSEYVSVGVLSSPYHGAGVDGVKYFTTQNGNTVASNVVTEATGVAIADATLHGYVAEGARTNLLTYSEQFDNGAWTNNSIITPDTAIAPNGTNTADTITSNGSIGSLGRNVSSVSGDPYTLSLYVKYTNNRWMLFQLSDIGATHRARVWFDIQNGVKGTSATTGSGVVVAYDITPVGNGWYRCSFTATNPITTLYTYFPFIVQGDGSITVSANGSSAYIWGAQLEQASFASSYIPTVASPVARNGDELSYPTAGNTGEGAFSLMFSMNRKNNTSTSVPIKAPITIGAYAANAQITLGGYYENKASILADFGTVWDISSGTLFSYTYGVQNTQAYRFGENLTTFSSFKDGVKYTDRVSAVPKTANWAGSPSKIYIACTHSGSDTDQNLLIRNVKIWKKALTDTQLTNMTSTNSAVAQSAVKKTTINTSQNTKITNGLVGFWSFNGPDMNGTLAYDRSGSGNNGTLTNSPTLIAGKVGQGLRFDGSDDYVVFPTNTLPSGNVPITFSAWVKWSGDGINANDIVFGYGKDFGDRRVVLLGIDSNNKGTFSFGSGNGLVTSTSILSLGTWYHLVGVYDASTTKIYFNGGLEGTTNFSTANISQSGDNGYNGAIGAIFSQYGSVGSGVTKRIGTFKGTIDEVRIYNRALSAEEVWQLYSIGAGTFSCGTSTIRDADKNVYNTAQIGTQCWMASNMMTTHYPDGTSITRGPTGATWDGTDHGYYAYPPNTSNDAEETLANIISNKLGFVYQWSAAMNGSTTEGAQGICPAGWHVPRDSEQYILENYLKDGTNSCDSSRSSTYDCDSAGTKLKTGTAGMTIPLAGNRYSNGSFANRTAVTYLWSSLQSGGNAWNRGLYSSEVRVSRNTHSKTYGLSVRCLKD